MTRNSKSYKVKDEITQNVITLRNLTGRSNYGTQLRIILGNSKQSSIKIPVIKKYRLNYDNDIYQNLAGILKSMCKRETIYHN